MPTVLQVSTNYTHAVISHTYVHTYKFLADIIVKVEVNT